MELIFAAADLIVVGFAIAWAFCGPALSGRGGAASPGAAADAATLSNYTYPKPDVSAGPFESS